MNKSEEIKVNITSRATHRGLEKSTTLNRRYVKRPTKLIITDESDRIAEKAEAVNTAPRIEYHKTRKISIIDSEDLKAEKEAAASVPKISHINIFEESEPVSAPEPVAEPEPEVKEIPDIPPAPNQYHAALDARKAENEARKSAEISSRALKDAAIARALAEMEERETEKPSKAALREEKIAEKVMLSEMKAEEKAKKKAKKSRKSTDREIHRLKKRKGGRILLALATSAACVIALAAVVKVNLPNISVKVAAVQTGVEASYPSYVPRDYNLSGVYTNDQSVIIEFKGPDNNSFTLAEEKTTWDSNALLTNYVKGAYGENYDVVREQGITIYINYSNATWVKDGIFYRITANSGVLSKKQIKNIVTSL